MSKYEKFMSYIRNPIEKTDDNTCYGFKECEESEEIDVKSFY